jgi:hypothetical protein
MKLDIPSELFDGSIATGISGDGIVLYFALKTNLIFSKSLIVQAGRNSSFLLSDMSKEEMSIKSGLSILSIDRNLNELCKRNWIKKIPLHKIDCYCLGEIKDDKDIWFLDLIIENKEVPKTETLKEKILRLAQENKEKRLTDSVLKVVPFVVKDTKEKCSDLILQFADRYKRKYSEKYPTVWGKDNVCIKRCLEWSDYKTVSETINFVFDNWDVLTSKTFLKGRPTIGMISSSEIWTQLQEFRKNKITGKNTDVTKDRADTIKIDEASDVGW